MQCYHNPHCSQSNAALDLLKKHGITPEVVLYLEERPTKSEIVTLLKKLGTPTRELVREREPEFAALKLENATDEELLEAMAKHPNLIQRPIFVHGDKAVIGRPPEKVLELLK